MSITKCDKKKNGLQGYRVRLRVPMPDGTVKQIERTAYGKAEAQAMEQLLLREMSDGVTVRLTVRSLYDEYMDAKRHDVRETTLDKTRRNLEHYVLPTLGAIRLDDLTPPVLQRWKNALAEQDISLKTRQNQYKELSALLNFATRRGYLPASPLSRVGNFRDVTFDKPQDTLHFYTPEEYLRFAQAARENAERKGRLSDWGFYVFFSVAFYTGARKGEINALRWTDIDGNILHIRRSITQKLKGEDRETPPKNKSSYRDLQIPAPLLRILDEHRARQESEDGFSPEWRVCGGRQCLRDSSIEHCNTAFCKAAELPHIRIHDFRHTHASLLVNEGINIQEIARRLGHAKVEQTWNTYSHLYPREEERAVAILDKIH